jgi:predicted transcriptional regulator of viral defense system
MLKRDRKTIYPRLSQLERARKLFSPAKGLYVVVPPEYRDWGVVPAEWFIDPMMRHLNREYYVSFLSAAARHGSAHQAPQTFQVIVNQHVPDRDLGRMHLRFVKSQAMETMDRARMMSHTGTYFVASKETTAVDLAWRPQLGSGISNVATVLRDLSDLDGEKLGRMAANRNRATARRLGWLLQHFCPSVDTFWLSQLARPTEGAPTALVPGNRPRGPVDKAWGIRLNGAVEPD